jgi:hypothetical protein
MVTKGQYNLKNRVPEPKIKPHENDIKKLSIVVGGKLR